MVTITQQANPLQLEDVSSKPPQSADGVKPSEVST
jgi:hypothetical protein